MACGGLAFPGKVHPVVGALLVRDEYGCRGFLLFLPFHLLLFFLEKLVPDGAVNEIFLLVELGEGRLGQEGEVVLCFHHSK
jgi:hypothetical protein